MTHEVSVFNWKRTGIIFIILTPILLFGSQLFLSQRFNRLVDIHSTRDPVIAAVRDSSLVDQSITVPEDAAASHLFWFHSGGSYYPPREGLAIRLLQNASLFKTVFPGFPEGMAQDEKLWNLYFRRGFNSVTYLPSLAEMSNRGFLIQTATLGCIDIYRAYGADVIIIGNSEVHSQIVQEIMSQNLRLPGIYAHPRVLVCAIGGFFPPVLSHLGDLFTKVKGAKVPVVIWGYSFFTAFTSSPKIKEFNLEMADIIDAYTPTPKTSINDKASLADSLKHDLNRRLTWNAVFPDALTFSRLQDNWNLVASSGRGDPEEVKVDDARTEDQLETTIAKQVRPGYHLLDGITEKDCDLTQASRDFDTVINSFMPMTSNFYVYLSPVTARQTLAAPGCFLENVKKMLHAKASSQVKTRTDDMTGYGLNYFDYMYPTYSPEVSRLEISHVNFGGAKKVTASLTRWLNQGWHEKGDVNR